MDETPRIVVGVDGSDASRIAIRWAMAEAELHGARLQAVHAWTTPMLFVPKAYRPELVEMGRMDEAALEFIHHELEVAEVDGGRGVIVEPTPVRGHAAEALVLASRNAKLVVVGRRGGGGFPHEVMGPKAVQVAHHAACPVAVVPDEWSGERRGIVVGIDGSAPARAALQWAATEGARRHTSITAVMAWGLLDQHHLDDDAATFDPHYDQVDALVALTGFVEEVLGPSEAGLVKREALNDLPARALIAQSESAELLVVGARGLGGFRDLLLGSVSHRCLAHSSCPTIVVR